MEHGKKGDNFIHVMSLYVICTEVYQIFPYLKRRVTSTIQSTRYEVLMITYCHFSCNIYSNIFVHKIKFVSAVAHSFKQSATVNTVQLYNFRSHFHISTCMKNDDFLIFSSFRDVFFLLLLLLFLFFVFRFLLVFFSSFARRHEAKEKLFHFFVSHHVQPKGKNE